MRTTILIAFCLALLLPAGASAGGFATVGMLNPPESVKPGETWTARFEILQHGRRETPMSNLSPAVLLTGADGKARRFEATATAEPGVYTADVVFPTAGRYEYTVDDGFTNAVAHTFPAIDVRAGAATSAPTADAGDFPYLPVVGGALLALAFAFAGVVLTRRRRGAMPA